jgi:hypothetical protein
MKLEYFYILLLYAGAEVNLVDFVMLAVIGQIFVSTLLIG